MATQPLLLLKSAEYVMATVHPSSILRLRTSDERREAKEQFVGDLYKAALVLESLVAPAHG